MTDGVNGLTENVAKLVGASNDHDAVEKADVILSQIAS